MPDFLTRLQAAIGSDYIVERELGGGGMSRVFVATERALERKVVVKVLPPELSVGVSIERFRREIQLAAQLQHPHIVPLLTASSDRELLWFTMPFIEGSSLRKTLARAHRLPPRDVLRILHDIVDALAYAHARGVVHRDIKPDNILTSGVHAMVTDFGVAKALSVAIPIGGHTTSGMAIGTPAYMAPEQLAADPAADHRVDIYAVGLLSYELLTGKSPFSGTSPQATLAAQLTVTPDAPHRLLSDVPEALSAIVMRCLEKDATRRFQSASELLAALDALPPMPGSGSVIGVAPPRRRWPTITAAAAALLVVSLAVAQRYGSGRRDAAIDTTNAAAAAAATNVTAASEGGLLRANGDTTLGFRSIDGDRDGTRPTTVPVVISRAESLAIAEAIQKRQAPPAPAVAANPTPETRAAREADSAQLDARGRVFISTPGGQVSVGRDQLLLEIRRLLSDSLQVAFSRVDSAMATLPRTVRMERPAAPATVITPLIPPPAEGRTRVVVTPFASRGSMPGELSRFGVDVADALRSALSRVAEVPDHELTARANVGGDRMASAWRLRADYLVSGHYLQRRDSLVVVLHFNDARTGRFTRAVQVSAPLVEPRRALDDVTSRTLAWLDTARAMPRGASSQSFQRDPARTPARPPTSAPPG